MSSLPDHRRPGGLSRRGLLTSVAGLGGLAALSPLLAACGGSDDESSASPSATGGGLTPVTYQLSWLPTTEHSGTWIALDKGYYTSAGLSVTTLNGGPNVTPDSVVVGGKALVGSTNADSLAQARLNGAPLKAFGARFQKNPFCILSLAETPLNTPQDMVGKKIGVNAGNETAFDLLLSLNGIDKSDLTVVPVQFDPAPVANKEVDGQIVFVNNEPTQLEVKGIKTHTFLLEDFGYHVFAGVYFATEETIDTKTDILTRFLRAERSGWTDNIADPNLGADLTVNKFGKDQGFNLQQQLLESESLKGIMTNKDTDEHGILCLSDTAMDQNIATLVKAGIKITKDELFTTKILDSL